MFGKWHLGQEQQSLPTSQGFDSYGVGILETTDGTLYPESMRRTGMSEEAISKTQPYIWESGADELEKSPMYDLQYRRKVEGDIAASAMHSFMKMCKDDHFFFTLGGHVHYPLLSFKGNLLLERMEIC